MVPWGLPFRRYRKKKKLYNKNYLFCFEFLDKYVKFKISFQRGKSDPHSMQFFGEKNPTGEKGDLSIVNASLCGETSFDVTDKLGYIIAQEYRHSM